MENVGETEEGSKKLEERIKRIETKSGQVNLADNLFQPQKQEKVKREIIQAIPMLHGRRELPKFDGKTALGEHMMLFETGAIVNDWNGSTKATTFSLTLHCDALIV